MLVDIFTCSVLIYQIGNFPVRWATPKNDRVTCRASDCALVWDSNSGEGVSETKKEEVVEARGGAEWRISADGGVKN
jgi:hypothetical protein